MKQLIKFLILMVLILCVVSCGKRYAQKDLEAFITRMTGGEDELLDGFFEKMEYKINKTTSEGGKKTIINTTVRVINVPAYAEDYIEQMMPLILAGASEEIINENIFRYFAELFKKEDLLYKETTLDVIMFKNAGGDWEILDGQFELIKAMTGVFAELEEISGLWGLKIIY